MRSEMFWAVFCLAEHTRNPATDSSSKSMQDKAVLDLKKVSLWIRIFTSTSFHTLGQPHHSPVSTVPGPASFPGGTGKKAVQWGRAILGPRKAKTCRLAIRAMAGPQEKGVHRVLKNGWEGVETGRGGGFSV